MTERIRQLKQFFIHEKAHHAYRQPALDRYAMARRFEADRMPALQRSVERLIAVLDSEQPVVFAQERIAFMRTVPVLPELFTPEEIAEMKKTHWLHEQGEVCNINVDYALLMNVGLDAKRAELKALAAGRQAKDETEKAEYLLAQERILAAVQRLADRYAQKARETGNTVVAETLAQVPAKAPRSLLEAFQMFRILHYTMWAGHNYHNTVGRLDQYMYPYFVRDMENHVYTEESALELVEEFFLTCNRDSDLYTGMQQGDNGQSLVLGGLNPDGTDGYNLLC